MASADGELEFRGFDQVGTETNGIEGATLASAATVTPTHGIHAVSGVAAISLIDLPYTGFAGTIRFRPTGIFTLATGGVATATSKPVGLAATAVVGKILEVTYCPVAGLWYPSYTA